jgi:hypothetical protein
MSVMGDGKKKLKIVVDLVESIFYIAVTPNERRGARLSKERMSHQPVSLRVEVEKLLIDIEARQHCNDVAFI